MTDLFTKNPKPLPKKWREPDGRLCHKIGSLTDPDGVELTVYRWWRPGRGWSFAAEQSWLINFRRGVFV